MRWLCDAGAVKDHATQSGHTALHNASAEGHDAVARLLCEMQPIQQQQQQPIPEIVGAVMPCVLQDRVTHPA